jgi:hypothetical protein
LGNVWDVARLSLQDYSIITDQRVRFIQPRSLMSFARSQEKNEWEVVSLKMPKEVDEKVAIVDAPLAEDEELNQQAIDDLRSALNELKIVNVERKPEALRKSLRDGKVDEDSVAAERSLGARGFFGGSLDGKSQILSSDGELSVTMKDGVEYVLRFGDVAEIGKEKKSSSSKADGEKADGENAADAKTDEKESDDGEGGVTLHRYLFVMAQFDENAIEKPKFEELPEAAAGDEAAKPDAPKSDEAGKDADAEKGGEADKPADAKVEDAPADGDAPADAKPDDAKSDAAKPESDAADSAAEKAEVEPQANAGRNSPFTFVAQQDEPAKEGAAADAASDDAKPDDTNAGDAKPADGATEERKPDDGKPDDAKPDDAAEDTSKPVDADKPAAEGAAAESPQDAAKKLEAERKRVEAENKRKQDDYDEKVAAAKKKVKEANERFADWYYVISEDVYKKIHLSRADVIKKQEKPAGETGSDSASPSDFPDLPPVLGN